MTPHERNELLAHWILMRGWLQPRDVEAAMQVVASQPGLDLCELLQQRNLLSPSQLSQLRAAITERIQQPISPDQADAAPTVPLAAYRAAPAQNAFAGGARAERQSASRHDWGVAPQPPSPQAPQAAPVSASASSIDLPAVSPGPIRPGEMFGPYLVEEEISRGGMGLVVRAVHTNVERPCALKFLLNPYPTSEELARFHREAKVLANLEHPHVLKVTDFGVEKGMMFFAMELVQGEDLHTLVDESFRTFKRPPETTWLARIAAAVVSALAYCHRKGVVHRDIKPQNVLIEADTQRPVLCDFGLIKRLSGDNTTQMNLSKSGTIWGTPIYMSPEQLCSRGEFGDIGPATDLWSLGATLFFAVTGQTPYAETELVPLYHAVRAGPPRDVRTLAPELEPWFADLIMALLQREQPARLSPQGLVEAVEAQVGALSLPPLGPYEPEPVDPEKINPSPELREESWFGRFVGRFKKDEGAAG